MDVILEHLQNTLSPDGNIRRKSEKVLESMEKNPGYAIMLLRVVEAAGHPDSANNISSSISLSAAITFKNYTKKNWRVDDDGVNKITDADRQNIKSTVVTLMLKSPEMLQNQLSEAISIIGDEDFPEKWPNLLTEMVGHFASGDFNVINGVLRTAHTLFKRYRYETRCDELWREIKLVLDTIASPLTELFKKTVEIVPTHLENKDVIKTLYNSLKWIAKIFYCLNYQDLPEFFEDNIKTWMDHFLTLLELDVPKLNTNNDDEAGLQEHLRSQICENVAMYAQKYDEEFAPYLRSFVLSIWTLLTKTGKEMKYDLLVSKAIHFLRSVCERQQQSNSLFGQDEINKICEEVIIPNMQFRPSDLEQFEDNPDEYMSRDMLKSDVDTRRRAACDLVRAFTKQFEQPTTVLFTRYVGDMLRSYSEAPDANWINKDAAIYLVTSLAQMGGTERHGATRTNQFVNLLDFFDNHIFPELQDNDATRLQVIKADCLRFVVTFRNIIGKERLIRVIPLMINLLRAPSRVLHTYAAFAIEKILVIKADGNQPLITKTDMEGNLEVLLTHIFCALQMEDSEENEYVMKALMRTISLTQEKCLPYMENLVQQLGSILERVSKNPSKPYFNHYLFECISLCIGNTCGNLQQPGVVASFEQLLIPLFTDILSRDVLEFVPYVFQVMSMLLELRPAPVPAEVTIYKELFPHLLEPVIWERNANIAPLVRLIQAIIEKYGNGIEDKLDNLLGVWQKLIASKANDHHGFALITSLFESLQSNRLNSWMPQIFKNLLMRLQKSKTTKYVRGLIVFFSNFIIKSSPDQFLQLLDNIQADMFLMVLDRVIVADMQKVVGKYERKICTVGYTKLLTNCSSMLTDDKYSQAWVSLLESLIKVFELPEDKTDENEHFAEIDESSTGYQASYSQLIYAKKKKSTPVAVDNPQQYLAQSLGALSKKQSIGSKLQLMNQEAQGFLQRYIAQAGVQIS